eukprot:6188567-Pleurochrysis_carterae.AAC.1
MGFLCCCAAPAIEEVDVGEIALDDEPKVSRVASIRVAVVAVVQVVQVVVAALSGTSKIRPIMLTRWARDRE